MILIEQRKLNKSMNVQDSRYLDTCNGNFIVLDDKTVQIDDRILEIFNRISLYGYNVEVINSDIVMNKVFNYFLESDFDKHFDMIVLVGIGGKQMFSNIIHREFFKGIEIVDLVWHRYWDSNSSSFFETDIYKYDFKDKKICLIEDVVATGNTLLTLKEMIEIRGGKVEMLMSALIQETSPLIHNSFVSMISGIKICKPDDFQKDPFWYPPIYSLRHLLYGDDEMEDFYDVFNDKYFNGDITVENMIKSYRRIKK